jgi:hypothetical protein
MKTVLAIFGLVIAIVSSLAQGTVIFNNRNLTGPNGTTYNAPVYGIMDPANTTAQMFLVTGTGATATYTPLTPVNTFRAPPNQAFLVGPVTVTVPGQPPGTTGLQFVVRVWEGRSYDSATARLQSYIFTVGPLGGTTADGQIFLPPDLGGPGGVGGLQFCSFCPEPSMTALALLGTVILLARRLELKDLRSFCRDDSKFPRGAD